MINIFISSLTLHTCLNLNLLDSSLNLFDGEVMKLHYLINLTFLMISYYVVP